MFENTRKLKKEEMNTSWDDIKVILGYVFLGFIGVIVFFLKGMFGQHKQMYDFYVNTQGKCQLHDDAIQDIEAVKINVARVESESKGAYKELLVRIDSNHQILMSRMNDAKKDNNQMQAKLDKLDSKIDQKKDKFN